MSAEESKRRAGGRDAAARAAAIEALVVERDLTSTDALDAAVRTFTEDFGPMNGARVIARAWKDGDYRRRLLEDATAAVGELGYLGAQGEQIVALENTPRTHNVVVCTLCSCYPWPLLGVPPTWYKSFAYRSRTVMEPRAVLREFGTDLPPEVEVRVWDSTAEVRYLVVPQRPADADDLSEADLAARVTREGMIGVARI